MISLRLCAATLLAGLLTMAQAAAVETLRNRLQDHPAPYLAMHGADPVAWQTWGEAAFELARQHNKPLFVSSGYFSCHWCHVMQRESYRDADIAAYINRHFIPVKIDRELVPDVDAGLIDFAKHTRGQAGWPLNVFLTPAGYPMFATLYQPPQTFHALLKNLTERWAQDAVELEALATAAVPDPAAVDAGPLPDYAHQRLMDQMLSQAMEKADELGGGFGAQSKFPMAPQLLVLLDIHAEQPDARLGDFLRLTLERMADLGLRDHLGGGFFRYTVDPDWRTPHFEKMLYDNALLARLYVRAARVFKEPAFAAIARETLDFVLERLAAPGGGYYAALSAVDAAGVEGGYYLWDADAIEAVAGPDWPWVKRYWGLDRPPAFEAGHHLIPHLSLTRTAAIAGQSVEQIETRLASLRETLLSQRDRRRLPIDTKVLTGWNALLLVALLEAADSREMGPHAARYSGAARALKDHLSGRMASTSGLLRARAGDFETAGSLEDYAYTLAGLQAWRARGGSDVEETLVAIESQAWERFHRRGRWYQGLDGLLRWNRGQLALADGALPSPAAVLLRHSTTGTERDANLGAAYPIIHESIFRYSSYLDLYKP